VSGGRFGIENLNSFSSHFEVKLCITNSCNLGFMQPISWLDCVSQYSTLETFLSCPPPFFPTTPKEIFRQITSFCEFSLDGHNFKNEHYSLDSGPTNIPFNEMMKKGFWDIKWMTIMMLIS
jgi:hypothetical protein